MDSFHPNPGLQQDHSLDTAISLLREHAQDTYLAVVVNTKRHFLDRNHGAADLRLSMLTEYLSDDELDEIISGPRSFGVATDVFFGEREFVDFLASGAGDRIDKRFRLVYSTSGSIRVRGGASFIPCLSALYGMFSCTPDAYALAIAQNKFLTFSMVKQFGVDAVPCWLFDARHGWNVGGRPEFGQKVIAKPLCGCASIGIDQGAVMTYGPGSDRILEDRSLTIAQPLFVQAFIEGYEIEVPVAALQHPFALGTAGISIGGHRDLGGEILDYDRVFSDDYQFYDFAAHSPILAQAIRAQAERIYAALDLTGLIRIDFRCTADGRFFPTDINLSPHLTRHGGVAACLGYGGRSYHQGMGVALAIGLQRALNAQPNLQRAE